MINDDIKKIVYDKLVTKVNAIDTSGFFLKTQDDTDKLGGENEISYAGKKIPDISGLVKKTDYNAKMTEIEVKIPSVTGLAIITALTAVKNKIPNVSNLVNKIDYDAKISDIESKCFTAPDYNRFTGQILDAKIKERGLVDKSAVAGFIDNADLNKKVVTIVTKAELKSRARQNSKAFDSSYFSGKRHFGDDGTQQLFTVSANLKVF